MTEFYELTEDVVAELRALDANIEFVRRDQAARATVVRFGGQERSVTDSVTPQNIEEVAEQVRVLAVLTRPHHSSRQFERAQLADIEREIAIEPNPK